MNPGLLPLALAAFLSAPQPPENPAAPASEVTVTLKEIALDEAIEEFQKFQAELNSYRDEVAKGEAAAQDLAAMIAELRENAGPENEYNEIPILTALQTYIDEVIEQKVGLVDFLESQRYRISYYASKMAASVEPQDISLLFGTPDQSAKSIRSKVESVSRIQGEIRGLLDELSQNNEFSLQTFQPSPTMSRENRRRLAELEFRYQNEKNALEFSKSRHRILEQSGRELAIAGPGGNLNVDLLLTQMFGALDRIRLQMSADLLNLENFLGLYERSTRAQDVLKAFEQLISMQGGIEGPSRGLNSVLDWLQDTSQRQLDIGFDALPENRKAFPRSSDLLREAYIKASGENDTESKPGLN